MFSASLLDDKMDSFQRTEEIMFLMGKRFLRCDIETNACHDVCLFLEEGKVQGHQILEA